MRAARLNKKFIGPTNFCNLTAAFYPQPFYPQQRDPEEVKMKITHQPSTLIEKERIRMQIIAQIDEFLRSGGEINVLTGPRQSVSGSIGCGWQDHDEIPPLTE